MIEVMRIVDHVLVWLFDNDVIFSPKHFGFSCIHTRVVGREYIIAEEILFRAVLRHYVSPRRCQSMVSDRLIAINTINNNQ